MEAAPGKSIVVPDDTPPVVDLTSPSDAPSEHPGLEFGISSVVSAVVLTSLLFMVFTITVTD